MHLGTKSAGKDSTGWIWPDQAACCCEPFLRGRPDIGPKQVLCQPCGVDLSLSPNCGVGPHTVWRHNTSPHAQHYVFQRRGVDTTMQMLYKYFLTNTTLSSANTCSPQILYCRCLLYLRSEVSSNI